MDIADFIVTMACGLCGVMAIILMTAPELLKLEMPLVRHIEQELMVHGYKPGTSEYNTVFKHTIAIYRKFGNGFWLR